MREPVYRPPAGGLEREDYRLLELLRSGFPDGWLERPGVAAVSGGADSMAMLELLAEARGGAGLTVAYVDHGIRPEAAFEAAWVAGAAHRLAAAFVRLDASGRGAGEAELRERRYAVLSECARRAGATWIATAHTADDQVETVLLRLIRGAGRRGLSGMTAVRNQIVRPLLAAKRRQLRDFLLRRGIGWCEDASNADPRYARNRLRHEVVPVIERAFGKDCLHRLPEAAARWREEDRYLEAETARFLAFAVSNAESGPRLDLVALNQAPPALRPRILRAWFERVSAGRTLSLAQLSCLEALAAGRAGSREARIAGVWLTREYDCLEVRRQRDDRANGFAIPVDLSQPGELEGPGGKWCLSIRPRPSGEAPLARSIALEAIDLDAAAFDQPLALRPVRHGDRARAQWGEGHRTVRDMMIDRKVPQRARHDWPVLATPESVVWVPGIALGEGIRLAGPHGQRVRLTWRRLKM